jgi:hypothetical protein
VLVWNSLPTASGVSPDLVLGQATFDSCASNDTDGDGVDDAAPSARSLWYPTGVWTDGARLVVADSSNNRVLVWRTFPTVDQQPADLVLGQPDMASNGGAAGASGLNGPYFVDSDGQQLWVADSANNRTLGWAAFPSASAQAADVVLGQSSFARSAPNDDDQDGVPDATPSARTMAYPSGVRISGSRLFVSDGNNSRVLVFGR